MPYEGQPFQNVIFLNSLKMKKKIDTIDIYTLISHRSANKSS